VRPHDDQLRGVPVGETDDGSGGLPDLDVVLDLERAAREELPGVVELRLVLVRRVREVVRPEAVCGPRRRGAVAPSS